MKKSPVLLIGLIAAIWVVSGWASAEKSLAQQENDRALKEECLKATIRSIEMEIKRFGERLKAAKEGPGNPANAPLFEKRISDLKAERERYQTMNPGTYILPEKKVVSVKVSQAYREGSVLELVHLSKSGPFYHIAGIKGNDYNTIRSGREYRMTIYLVYSRDYPFASQYVYVSDF